ncbi:EAL domain-containing protein [Geminocystis sp. CENA526]|uniref:EAL domain-containing protein n=1 Tax=Geminocystis sp. CENA526 TaxID=1355871 RepID=UPI003D6FA79B
MNKNKTVNIVSSEKKYSLIYAVDDQKINLNLLSVFLTHQGFKIITETDILKAIPDIEKTQPDLILLDILMPNLNGFEACTLLKSSPATKDIPIIFLSALDDINDKVKGLELGAVDYVTKPFQFPELLSRINVCLKLQKLHDDLEAQNKNLIREVKARKNAQLALKKSEERLRTIINNNLNGMVVVDHDGMILFVNQEAEKIFDRTREKMLGENLGLPLELEQISELEIPRSNRELITVEMRAVPMIWNDKSAYLISFIDITEKKKMEEKLKILFQASEQSPASIVITNIEGNIEYVNPKFEQISGYKEEEVLGKNPRILQSGHFTQCDYKHLWQTISQGKEWQGEFHNRKKTGELYWEKALISPIFNSAGAITHFMAVKEDITEKKQQELLLQYQAKYDHLTKIPNRNYALEKVNHLIIQASDTKTNLGLMFIDLDHFKEVNDNLGHDFGDELLIQATQRMKNALRNTDLLARLGGDEFFIAIPFVEKFSDLEKIAVKIIDLLHQSFQIFDHDVFISASVGITIFPQDGDNLKQLIRNADLAMYESKKNGRNQFQFYQLEMNKKEINKSTLEQNFLRAIENNEFKIVYQPIVEINSQLIVKAEALIRWESEEVGLIYPDKFLPMLEKKGLILILEDWILKSVTKDMKTWRNIKNIPISINLSEYQFQDIELIKNIIDFIIDQKDGSIVELEIKEDILLERKYLVTEILHTLSQSGINLCLDNFGLGLFSLNNLQKFKFKFIKIDQYLTKDLTKNPETKLLIKSIILLAKALNIKIIAHGIETTAELDILKELNCDYGQGYLFSKPLSPANFYQYLLKQQQEIDDSIRKIYLS